MVQQSNSIKLLSLDEFIKESAYATVDNTPGMGAVILPIADGTKEGSGDLPNNKKKKKNKDKATEM